MEVTLFFLNLKSSSSTKSSLAGKIKNWAALVEKATVKKHLHVDPKPLQPVSIASSVTKLKTLTVSDIAGPPPMENIPSIGQNTMVNDDSVLEDLVGSFGDDDLDDAMEQEAALLNKKQSVCRLFEN